MSGDLISRKAFLDEFEWLLSVVNESSKAEVQETIQRIKNAPAVDAVEVVRCDQCIFRSYSDSFNSYYCKKWDVDDYEEAFVEDDDFCSRGERRSE